MLVCVCVREREKEREIEVYVQNLLKVRDKKALGNILRELNGARANEKWNRRSHESGGAPCGGPGKRERTAPVSGTDAG